MNGKQPYNSGKDQGSWMLTLGVRHFPKQPKLALRNDRRSVGVIFQEGEWVIDTTSVKTGE